MIERATEFGASAAMPLVAPDTDGQSAGAILRQAREAHGLDASVLAASLKVPTQKIEALEADDHAALSDPVFVRALAASICRTLRIDAGPVLDRLPQAPGAAALGNLSHQMRRPSFQADELHGGNPRPSRWLLAGVGILLLAAAVLWWLPQSTLESARAWWGGLFSHGASAPAAASETSPHSSDVAGEGLAVESVAHGASVLASNAAPATAPAAAVGEGSTATALTTPVMGAVAAKSDDTLVLNARGVAWISVHDASGKLVQKEQTLQAGDTVSFSGTMPLSVVIGRAADVDVQVRGKPFDLKPLTGPNGVARFEVK